MTVNRRNFLMAGIAAAAGATTSGAKAVAKALTPAAGTSTAVVTNAATGRALAGAYGVGVRAQVFEVIVRQGLAGAPWKEICRGPMQINQISDEEVEKEIARRAELIGMHPNHKVSDAYSRLLCAACRKESSAEALAGHPVHKEMLAGYCATCLAENKEYAEERRDMLLLHPESHAEYVRGCDFCWSDYLNGKRTHPKFGRRVMDG